MIIVTPSKTKTEGEEMRNILSFFACAYLGGALVVTFDIKVTDLDFWAVYLPAAALVSLCGVIDK